MFMLQRKQHVLTSCAASSWPMAVSAPWFRPQGLGIYSARSPVSADLISAH